VVPETYMSGPLAYSVADAIKLSSIKRTKLYSLIKEKKIDVVKIGRRTLVKADSLHRLINGTT
tara:strand:- start:5006 stop:5194 length:189 start_codon:yes stop_codon:yes gene_type:complete